MKSATLLAFDYGDKRIGVAAGQTISASAQGVATVLNNRGTPDWKTVDKLLQEWRPASLVVGLPISMDGDETDISKRARAFAKSLQQKYEIDVALHDERLSSNEADAVIKSEYGSRGQKGSRGKTLSKKRQQTRDQVAAALILQSYFSSVYRNQPPNLQT